jgi:hypothetical protein
VRIIAVKIIAVKIVAVRIVTREDREVSSPVDALFKTKENEDDRP